MLALVSLLDPRVSLMFIPLRLALWTLPRSPFSIVLFGVLWIVRDSPEGGPPPLLSISPAAIPLAPGLIAPRCIRPPGTPVRVSLVPVVVWLVPWTGPLSVGLVCLLLAKRRCGLPCTLVICY